jgi:hypothetical protein
MVMTVITAATAITALLLIAVLAEEDRTGWPLPNAWPLSLGRLRLPHRILNFLFFLLAFPRNGGHGECLHVDWQSREREPRPF